MDKLSKAELRFLSGLFTDFAAAWFMTVYIVPVFSLSWIVVVKNLLFGLTFSWMAIKMEQQYDISR